MRKILSIFLVCLLLFSYTTVFADEMILVTQKPITVSYNGDGISFPDALPMIQNGRTLVPARAIMERAKLSVSFDAPTKTVTAVRDDLTIKMTIDETTATVTKGDETKSITLDEPARIIGDRTYVPIRFIGESMELKVNWNANYREVVLIDTGEWWQEISENAKFLDYLLNSPVANQEASAGNFSANIDLSLILKNLPKELNLPSSMSLKFNFNVTGTEVYDGQNDGSYALIEADLSSLQTLFKYLDGVDPKELDNWAKMHKIDLDIIVDKDWNLYIKSTGFHKLMKDFGISDPRIDAMDGKYLVVPISDLLDVSLPEMETCKTLRDLLENLIASDDMLYTQSAKMLDDTLALYINMFHNDAVRITERYDGSELWSLTLNQDNASDLLVDMTQLSSTSAGAPLTKDQLDEKKAKLDKTSFKMTVNMTVKNGILQKSEVLYTVDTGDVEINEADNIPARKTPTMRTVYTVNIGASTRKFNSHSDKKITIPKNIITLQELEHLTPIEN